MKYIRKAKSKALLRGKGNGAAASAGGGLTPDPELPPSGEFAFDPANIVGPRSGQSNDGVYAVTANNITVTTAPTSGNRATIVYYTANGATGNELSYTMTYTGTAVDGNGFGFVQPNAGQTVQQALTAYIENQTPQAGITYFFGGRGSAATLVGQLSSVQAVGNVAPGGLNSGDVFNLTFNRTTGVAVLRVNSVVQSTMTITGYNATEPFYPFWSYDENNVAPAGDSYVFDFSGLS